MFVVTSGSPAHPRLLRRRRVVERGKPSSYLVDGVCPCTACHEVIKQTINAARTHPGLERKPNGSFGLRSFTRSPHASVELKETFSVNGQQTNQGVSSFFLETEDGF
jgi:hypothetical protein